LFTLSSEGEPARILSSTGQKPLRAARRKPGQGPPPLRRLFQSERHPAGGQCADRPDEVGADVRLGSAGLACVRCLPQEELNYAGSPVCVVSGRESKARRLKPTLLKALGALPCPIRIAQRNGGDTRSLRMAML
jgi:hypothetical protein